MTLSIFKEDLYLLLADGLSTHNPGLSQSNQGLKSFEAGLKHQGGLIYFQPQFSWSLFLES